MPFYFDTESADVLAQHEAGQDLPAPAQPIGMLKSIGMGGARGALKLGKAALFTATALNENPEFAYRFADKYIDPAIQAMTPDPQQVSKAGSILGKISELPGQLLLGPVGLLDSSIMNTGTDLVDAGVKPGAAVLAGIDTGAATAGMMNLPQAGPTLARTVGLVAANPVLGAATDAAISKGLAASGYTEQAKAFDPLNVESRSMDLLMGTVFAALGYRGHVVSERARAESKPLVAKAQALIDKLGGHEGVMDRLPVEVVDALSVARDYQKQVESNPFDKAAKDGLQRHIDMLGKAVADIQEQGRVDVSGMAPAAEPMALNRDTTPPEVQRVRTAVDEHAVEVAGDLHAMGGTDRDSFWTEQGDQPPAREPAPMTGESSIVSATAQETASKSPSMTEIRKGVMQRDDRIVKVTSTGALREYFTAGRIDAGLYGSDQVVGFTQNPGSNTWSVAVRAIDPATGALGEERTHATAPSTRQMYQAMTADGWTFHRNRAEAVKAAKENAAAPIPKPALVERVHHADPLDAATERLFEERGDFEVYQGKDTAGKDVYRSARDLVDTAKEDLARTRELGDIYKQAAACLGIGA